MIPRLILHHESFLHIDEQFEDEVGTDDSRIFEVKEPKRNPQKLGDNHCLGEDRKRTFNEISSICLCKELWIILLVLFGERPTLSSIGPSKKEVEDLEEPPSKGFLEEDALHLVFNLLVLALLKWEQADFEKSRVFFDVRPTATCAITDHI